MKTINRTALTVIPQQPYIDWANGFNDEGPGMEQDAVPVTSYLIPDQYDEFNYDDFLRKHFNEIFGEELNSWTADTALWPKKRTYALFLKWFWVVPSDMVVEMGDGPIEIEEI